MYTTDVNSINMAPDETIGLLTPDDVVTLLKEIQKAMTLQYYTNAKKIEKPGTKTAGDSWKFKIVHRDGEYGVYKLGITQLVDSGIVGKEINDWINTNLPNITVPAPGQEQYQSWYNWYLNVAAEDVTVVAAPSSVRNNALYYMLSHAVRGNPKFTPPVHPFVDLSMESFIRNPELQDLAAANLMKFTYNLLLTSRAITVNVDKKTLAGILSLAICFNIDAAQNYIKGTVKSDEDGISAKYWFDVGFNAVATPLEKVATPGPAANTTSIVKEEEVTPVEETPPVAGQKTTETAPVSSSNVPPAQKQERPTKITKTITNGSIIYELSTDGSITAKVVTGTKQSPPAPATPVPSNPYQYQTQGIKIELSYDESLYYNLQISDVIYEGRVLASEFLESITSLKSSVIAQLEKEKRSGLSYDRATPQDFAVAVDSIIKWMDEKLFDVAAGLKQLLEVAEEKNKNEAQSNKIIAFSDPAVVESLVLQLDSNRTQAERDGHLFVVQACDSAKADIQSNFETDTAPLATAATQTTQTAADGSSTTSVTTVHDSGAVTTVTTTTNADGTVTQTKTVKSVEPSLKDPPPSNIKNGIDHPAQNKDAMNTDVNAPSAENLPVNQVLAAEDDKKGFKDPKKNYPKPDYQNKPDTNTLALGVNSPNINSDPRTMGGDKSSQSLGSSPAARNASRKRGVKMAGRSGATWEQPPTPYAAKYPYNKVFAGESGHALEIDDTPGFERLNIAHKSGTFTETGPDGTQVNKIVGNGYTILEKDGFVLIEGSANVHIAGQCNVFIMNDTTMTMHGKVNLDIHNDVNVNIGGSLGLSVQEGIYLRNEGNISVQNKGNVDSEISGAVATKVTGKYNLTTDAGLNLTSKVHTHIKSAGSFYNHSTGDINLCTDAGMKIKTGAAVDVKSGAAVNVTSAGAMNTKSGAAINLEGAGNISLKAPLVTSSPIDTATIDVTTANITTLNAGTTNLRGTHNTTDDTTNIRGSTTAGVTAPASATEAAEAVCAVAAKQPVTYTLEQPVSMSSPLPIERTNDGVKTGYDGENSSSNTDGGEPDSNGNVQGQTSGSSGDNCLAGNDPSSNDGGAASGSDDTSETVPPVAGRSSIPSKDCNTLKGAKLPPLPKEGQPYDGTLKISPRITLAQLCNGRDGCPNGWKDLRGHRSPGSKQNEYEILNNLRCLAVNIIEPLMDKYGSVSWSCAFRKYYPDGKKSKLDPNAHGWGSAVDLSFPKLSVKQYIDVCKWAAANLSAYDQIILEKNASGSVWVHIGYTYKTGASRGQQLSARPNGRGGMSYTPGFKQV